MEGRKLPVLSERAIDLLRFLGGGLRGVAPATRILFVFQLLGPRQFSRGWRGIAVSLVLTVVGLVIFLN